MGTGIVDPVQFGNEQLVINSRRVEFSVFAVCRVCNRIDSQFRTSCRDSSLPCAGFNSTEDFRHNDQPACWCLSPIRNLRWAVCHEHVSVSAALRLRCAQRKTITNSLLEMMMGRKVVWLNTWIVMVLVMMSALVRGVAAQTNATDKNMGNADFLVLVAAPGILPSGFGDDVDRDVMTIRGATARFKTTEAAVAAGYKQVTGC